MTENSERCCTCTTPEITIKLNKQGPQGLTGPQGEPGFSPAIEVSEETPTSYRLSIQTLEGSYETPNLKANFPLGGYVNQVLVKQSNADGDATWDYIPYATTETTGGLTLATEDDVVVGSDKAITGDILAKVVAGYVDLTSNQTISGYKTFSKHLEVVEAVEVRYSNRSVQRGEINPTVYGGTISVYTPSNWAGQIGVQEYNSDTRMWLQAPYQSSTLHINNYSDGSAPSGNANTVIISGSNIKSQRNSQTYTIVDAGNIRDIISDTANLLLPTVTFLKRYLWDASTNAIIESIETSGGVTGHYTIGNVSTGLRLHSAGEIKIRHNSTDYTNLDSGNISSDPYIQSLVARIEALES